MNWPHPVLKTHSLLKLNNIVIGLSFEQLSWRLVLSVTKCHQVSHKKVRTNFSEEPKWEPRPWSPPCPTRAHPFLSNRFTSLSYLVNFISSSALYAAAIVIFSHIRIYDVQSEAVFFEAAGTHDVIHDCFRGGVGIPTGQRSPCCDLIALETNLNTISFDSVSKNKKKTIRHLIIKPYIFSLFSEKKKMFLTGTRVFKIYPNVKSYKLALCFIVTVSFEIPVQQDQE